MPQLPPKLCFIRNYLPFDIPASNLLLHIKQLVLYDVLKKAVLSKTSIDAKTRHHCSGDDYDRPGDNHTGVKVRPLYVDKIVPVRICGREEFPSGLFKV